MKVRREGALLSEEAPRTGAELTELPPRDGWGKRLLRADKLVRNLAVVGAMLMTPFCIGGGMLKTLFPTHGGRMRHPPQNMALDKLNLYIYASSFV